jgi:hypothetical protein
MYRPSGGKAPLNLTFSTRWRWVVWSHAPVTLPSGRTTVPTEHEVTYNIVMITRKIIYTTTSAPHWIHIPGTPPICVCKHENEFHKIETADVLQCSCAFTLNPNSPQLLALHFYQFCSPAPRHLNFTLGRTQNSALTALMGRTFTAVSANGLWPYARTWLFQGPPLRKFCFQANLI